MPPTHPTKICSSSFLNVLAWLWLSLSLRRSLRSLRYRSPPRSSSGRGYSEARLIPRGGLDRSDHGGQGKNTVLYTRHFAKSTHLYCFQCTALSRSTKPTQPTERAESLCGAQSGLKNPSAATNFHPPLLILMYPLDGPATLPVGGVCFAGLKIFHKKDPVAQRDQERLRGSNY